MSFLIDGHNLIGQMPDIHLDDPRDEAKLVERLRRYRARTGARITVIFDSGLPAGESAGLSGGGVTAVFARPGVPADALILQRIGQARNPRSLTVVTSDAEVADAARRRGINVVLSHEFAAELNAPPSAEADAAEKLKSARVRLSPQELAEWLALFDAQE
jgi:predicted RNA-binding protein with PIN domain